MNQYACLYTHIMHRYCVLIPKIFIFLDMRKIGSGRGLVSAYPRQLESLIRLSEAHAKMRFSNTVEIVDVEEAKRLHREALKQSATDPKTGIIDVGILTTGVSASERDRRRELAKELKRMLQVNYNSKITYLCHFFFVYWILILK